MVTTYEYACLSEHVYTLGVPKAKVDEENRKAKAKDPEFKPPPPLERLRFKVAENIGMGWGLTGTDFKAAVYEREDGSERVIAFQGTVPAKAGDLLADLQIVIGRLPQYCDAAYRLVSQVVGRGTGPGRRVFLTGHSLGGGMAQVMGHWTGLPFVTFNAPGMWGDIQKSKFMLGEVVWSYVKDWWRGDEQKSDLRRSWEGAVKGSAVAKQRASTGRNFRCVYDPVSGYGMHYGPVTRLYYLAGLTGHGMTAMRRKIEQETRWKDVDPLDPKNKEWGELD